MVRSVVVPLTPAQGAFMAADFRVHQQCDEQLKTIKEPLRGMLDMARRDVYGYCLAISASSPSVH